MTNSVLLQYSAKLALRSSFNYHFTSRGGRDILVIVDNNQGLSVTNNIENIIQYLIERTESTIPINNLLTIYKDTESTYDGFDFETMSFISLQEISEEDALESIVIWAQSNKN